MSDDMTNLSPCPFCGGGETRIDETKTRASLLEPYEVIAVYVRHWCGGFERGAQSATIQVRGRNHSDAIAAWNRRAAQEVRPMINDKLDWIAEIRSRHVNDERWRNSPSMICPQQHNDRAALLVEIERLRAFNVNAARETLEAVGKAADDAREEMRAEVDRLRAENERLRGERDALRDAAREYLETLGGAMKSGKFEMGGTAEMAHFVRQAMQRLDSLVFDRDGPRPAGLERLHEPLKRPS